MYKVIEQYANSIIVSKRPSYPRNEGGRFELAKCSQKDLKYLYEILAMTDVVEYVSIPQENEKIPKARTPKEK